MNEHEVSEEDLFEQYKGKLRRLTPLECCRQMDFDIGVYEAMREAGLNDKAIYHICGDSIIVACLEKIFERFKNEKEE